MKKTTHIGKPTAHLLYILDESGSMIDIKSSVISGFNEYINGLRGEKIKVTLTKFDTLGIRTPYQDLLVKEVPALNQETYKPGAGTPLYDAAVSAIEGLAERIKDNEPALVVVMTDGQENSSTKHDEKCLRDLIQKLEKKGNWTFIFMGANQDSWAVASKMGFPSGNVVDWAADVSGTRAVYDSLSQNTIMYMSAMADNSLKGAPLNSTAFFKEEETK